MGNQTILENSCCVSCRNTPIETEHVNTNYNAMSDKFLMTIENSYNLLLKIPFNEYAKVLLSFSQSGPLSTSSNSTPNNKSANNVSFAMLDEPISDDVFQHFISNKIIANDVLYNFTLENDHQTIMIFKDLLIETYRDFKKNFAIYSEDKYNITRKYHLLALGIVYCSGRVRDKVDFIFKLFKNSNNNFHKSQELNRFMLSCFLLPSCCQVFARMKMAMKYPFLGDISKEDMLSILDAFELSDLERLVGIVNGMLFKEKNFVNYNEYIEVFQYNKLEWMLCPSGIRFNLEKFNDVKNNSKLIHSNDETKSESSIP